MKRRISVEQLQELTAEQQQKLREWWKPEDADLFINSIAIEDGWIGVYEKGNFQAWHELTLDALPLLDIGQMIELLEQKHPAMELGRNYYEDLTYKWDVEGNEALELCDALWEAVKQVLGV